jgi:hypothetical protein
VEGRELSAGEAKDKQPRGDEHAAGDPGGQVRDPAGGQGRNSGAQAHQGEAGALAEVEARGWRVGETRCECGGVHDAILLALSAVSA